MFFAALWSRSCRVPQDGHCHVRVFKFRSARRYPHAEHVLDEGYHRPAVITRRPPTWGIFGIAEAQAGVLPPDLEGLDSIELGCGTGYVSAWLARRGVRPAGLDNSSAQLRTARELQVRFGLRFPLFHANAEQAPFADASFDLAITEYGASIWCDPYAWIPEAARLLRPGDRQAGDGCRGDAHAHTHDIDSALPRAARESRSCCEARTPCGSSAS